MIVSAVIVFLAATAAPCFRFRLPDAPSIVFPVPRAMPLEGPGNPLFRPRRNAARRSSRGRFRRFPRPLLALRDTDADTAIEKLR
ncbi:hypothetical protein [Streptomyces sp. NPDC059894]|uniref:hypothetical protein n=1 Tax=unclassified Streptomyces TaxID=2593676 RepID=UPI0036668FD5